MLSTIQAAANCLLGSCCTDLYNTTGLDGQINVDPPQR